MALPQRQRLESRRDVVQHVGTHCDFEMFSRSFIITLAVLGSCMAGDDVTVLTAREWCMCVCVCVWCVFLHVKPMFCDDVHCHSGDNRKTAVSYTHLTLPTSDLV